MSSTTVTPDLQPLDEWCRAQTPPISPSNARGYYIPQNRIPGATKVAGRWWVPVGSALKAAESTPSRTSAA